MPRGKEFERETFVQEPEPRNQRSSEEKEDDTCETPIEPKDHGIHDCLIEKRLLSGYIVDEIDERSPSLDAK